MSAGYSLPNIAIAVLAAAALGACATNTGPGKINTGDFRQLPEDRNLVLLEVPQYRDTKPVRVTYNDRRITEEYSLFRSAQGQAEVFYAKASTYSGSNVVLDFNKLISSSVRMWRFNQGQTLTFDEAFLVKNGIAEFWVQPYNQVEAGRACAGFSATWEVRPNDRQLRPSKAMFGYHCAPKGTAFSPGDAQELVQSLQIRGVSVPLRVETVYEMRKGEIPAPPKDVQKTLMVLAQDGGGGGIAGMPEFPLLIARVFTDLDGPCSNC